ncbi:MAG: hypothetical protein K0Q53_259 [Massilibacillus sp.]|jgi:hypothetical protein|nr:hypothetical protein [Massilibacillus sp.]
MSDFAEWITVESDILVKPEVSTLKVQVCALSVQSDLKIY